MKLEIIKKLLKAPSREDNKLGLAYLAEYVNKEGLEAIKKHVPGGVRPDCYHLTDFKCHYWVSEDGLVLIHKDFSLNLGTKNVVYSPNYGGHYLEMKKNYEGTDNIIYV